VLPIFRGCVLPIFREANVLPIFREAKSILERPNQFKRTWKVEVKTSI
jgi:hypothetical protein